MHNRQIMQSFFPILEALQGRAETHRTPHVEGSAQSTFVLRRASARQRCRGRSVSDKRRLLTLAREHARLSSQRPSLQVRAEGRWLDETETLRRRRDVDGNHSLVTPQLNISTAKMTSCVIVRWERPRECRRRTQSRGVFELLSAGSQRCQDDSPLIHLASGSWVWNSALNRSSTVSLVSLPGWLSTAGARTERNKQAVNRRARFLPNPSV